jgi:hypothetical protein
MQSSSFRIIRMSIIIIIIIINSRIISTTNNYFSASKHTINILIINSRHCFFIRKEHFSLNNTLRGHSFPNSYRTNKFIINISKCINFFLPILFILNIFNTISRTNIISIHVILSTQNHTTSRA